MSFNDPPNFPPPGPPPNEPGGFNPPGFEPVPPAAPAGEFAPPPTPVAGIPTQAMPAGAPIDTGYGAPPPEKKNTGLIVAAVIAVLALLGVGAFMLLKDDDDGSDAIVADSTLLETTVATTVAPTSTVVEETLPATTTTVEVTTTTEAPTTTVAPTEPPMDAEPVTDDTGKFSVLVPPGAEVDTAPFEVEGFSIPHVSAADDLSEYQDGYDAAGYSVMAVPPEVAPTAADLIVLFTPDDTICTTVTQMPGYITDIATTEVVTGEGCGDTGTASQVTMAVDVPSFGVVVMVYAQGPQDAATLLAFAEQILASVVLY